MEDTLVAQEPFINELLSLIIEAISPFPREAEAGPYYRFEVLGKPIKSAQTLEAMSPQAARSTLIREMGRPAVARDAVNKALSVGMPRGTLSEYLRNRRGPETLMSNPNWLGYIRGAHYTGHALQSDPLYHELQTAGKSLASPWDISRWGPGAPGSLKNAPADPMVVVDFLRKRPHKFFYPESELDLSLAELLYYGDPRDYTNIVPKVVQENPNLRLLDLAKLLQKKHPMQFRILQAPESVGQSALFDQAGQMVISQELYDAILQEIVKAGQKVK